MGADHLANLKGDAAGMNGEKVAMFIMDVYTRFPYLAALRNKSAEESIRAMRYYLGSDSMKTFYSDGSRELAAVGRELAEIHQTSPPYRSQGNSITERGIRTMLEGTRCNLVGAGLPHRFWPLAGAHHAFATAISEQGSGDPAPYWLKFGEDFGGWRLPFGALVHYRPPKPVLKSLPKFSPTSIPGIFVGWHLEPGCRWRGDYLVISLGQFKVPGRRNFSIHRIKEVVSFDAMHFPLQASRMAELSTVDCPSPEGEVIGPDQVEEEVKEDVKLSKSAVDVHYKDMFGVDPPKEMGYTEKRDRIEMELFGSDDDEEVPAKESEKRDEIDLNEDDVADDAPAEGSGEQPVSIEAERSEPRADDDVPARYVLRSRRVPMSAKSSAMVASVIAPPETSPTWCSDAKACKDKQYTSMVAKAKEPEKTTAVSRLITRPSDRKLVEYCCSETSRLGQDRFVASGCIVARLTAKDDMTTEEGLQTALNEIRSTPEGTHLHLWGSLPCTAGSPWQRLNRRHSNARRLIQMHMDVFHKLIANFVIVAREIVSRGGDVSFEWPTGCELWKEPAVESMKAEFSMNVVNVHGCAMGLTDRDGSPVKKPWSIATTSPSMVHRLESKVCPGPDHHPVHTPCAGQITKMTEGYTDVMAEIVHAAIQDDALLRRASGAIAILKDKWQDEYEDAIESMNGMPEPSGHREKVGNEGLWCAMVTKTLHPSDPMRNDPGAKAALNDELGDLRSYPVWDEEEPIEAKALAVEMPHAHVARIFPVFGVKNWEHVPSRKWKARVVFEGSHVKTATGQWALFHDIGAIPSTMSACRAALAVYCLVPGARLYQSDCVKAYVQALMRGTPTYVRLPKAWWPSHWVGRFVDPVCKLLRALYGHPDAGNSWADKITEELVRMDFVEVEGWNAVFVLHVSEVHVIVFVLYVDDLIMAGSGRIEEIIAKVRENIRMDDPSNMQKYLGVVHHIASREAHGERITEVVFDMESYFKSAIEDYLELSGTKLSKAASPYAPKIDGEDLDKMMEQEGRLAKHAAHLVMKLMYGARMALPYLCIVIGRLSSQLTRWTADSDRRLHRIYCYLQDALDIKLAGSLSTEDLGDFVISAWPDADLNGDVYTTKSTSGFWLELQGKNGRRFPLGWGAKKQGSTALCTAEAEVISLAACVRNEAIPMQHLLETIFRRRIPCEVHEDNAATIVGITKGFSPSLRHLVRTQRVSLGFLHEIFIKNAKMKNEDKRDVELILKKAETSEHRGDLFTKELDPQKFQAALGLIGMRKIDLPKDEK